MSLYRVESLVLITTDPLHVGAGGYRLARVDNTIIREPGTGVPKIPGTTLAGAARAYAARRYQKPSCAGQGPREHPHCGQSSCPICYTFGSLVGESAFAGTASLSDAQLLLFPVHTMHGPVWVTTEALLKDAGFALSTSADFSEAQALLSFAWSLPLNFGWLVLKTGPAPAITSPWPSSSDWEAIKARVAIVEESLFAVIVNSNLEVRTSVSIDPFTGAAKSGALFTYEALPRGAWLAMEVVEDDYRSGGKPWSATAPVTQTAAGEDLGASWSSPLDVVKGGLKLAEWLGVGGMGTRGFGRIKIAGSRLVTG